jgi:hypothetical protein
MFSTRFFSHGFLRRAGAGRREAERGEGEQR